VGSPAPAFCCRRTGTATWWTVDALSVHADRDELLRWLGGFTAPPGRTFVIHGEPQASEALCRTLGEWGWEVAVARLGATVEL